MLSLLVLGVLSFLRIPMDVLPVYNNPAVQVLTFYSGMPAEPVADTITTPMERMTGQAAGMKLLESRSLLGVSIVRNYFHNTVDPNGALTQINSLALGEIPNLPDGTLPPRRAALRPDRHRPGLPGGRGQPDRGRVGPVRRGPL
jgi:multidrug efflux pump subunit AcrB